MRDNEPKAPAKPAAWDCGLVSLSHDSRWLQLQARLRPAEPRRWDGETIPLAPFGVAPPVA